MLLLLSSFAALILVEAREEDCGHVDALTMTGYIPSSEIYIYNGRYFYMYNLQTNELSDKLSMEEYWPGVETPVNAAFLAHQGEEGYLMMFNKEDHMFIHGYGKGAFKEKSGLLENLEHRTAEALNISITGKEMGNSWVGMAYNDRDDVADESRMKVCNNGNFQVCRIKATGKNPVHDCHQDGTISSKFTKDCAGLAFAHYDNVYRLVMATSTNLLLFPMEDGIKLNPNPSTELELSTIFSCKTEWSFVVPTMIALVVLALVLNIAAIGFLIWTKRKRREMREGSSHESESNATLTIPRSTQTEKSDYNKI